MLSVLLIMSISVSIHAGPKDEWIVLLDTSTSMDQNDRDGQSRRVLINFYEELKRKFGSFRTRLIKGHIKTVAFKGTVSDYSSMERLKRKILNAGTGERNINPIGELDDLQIHDPNDPYSSLTNKNVLIITDGVDGYEDPAIRAARKLKSERGIVYIMGIDLDTNAQQSLTKVAEAGGGKFCNGNASDFAKLRGCLLSTTKIYRWNQERKGCFDDNTFINQRGLNELPPYEEFQHYPEWRCYDFSNQDLRDYRYSGLITKKNIDGSSLNGSNISGLKFYNKGGIQAVDFRNADFSKTEFNVDISDSRFFNGQVKEVKFNRNLNNNTFIEIVFNSSLFTQLGNNNIFEKSTFNKTFFTINEASPFGYGEGKNYIKSSNLNDVEITTSTFSNDNCLDLSFETVKANNLKVYATLFCRHNLKNTKFTKSEYTNVTANKSFFDYVTFDFTRMKTVKFYQGSSGETDAATNVSYLNSSTLDDVTFNGHFYMGNFKVENSSLVELSIFGDNFRSNVDNAVFKNLQGRGVINFGITNVTNIDLSTSVYDLRFSNSKVTEPKFGQGFGNYARKVHFIKTLCETCDFSEKVFDGVRFTNSTLNGGNFEKTSIKKYFKVDDSTLSDTNLKAGNFTGVEINKSRFEKSDFLGFTGFQNAVITNSVFDGANLKDIWFKGSNLTGSSFQKANLENVNLPDALNNNNFNEAKMSKVSLSGRIIKNSTFEKIADLESSLGGSFLNVKCDQCSFNDSSIYGGFSGNSVIKNSTFQRTKFTSGELSGEITDSNFDGATFDYFKLGTITTKAFHKISFNNTTFGTASSFNHIKGNKLYFNNAYLEDISINDSSFDNSSFNGVFLGDASIRKSKFNKTNIKLSSFKSAHISDSTFNNVDFTGTDFTNSNLFKTVFKKSVLRYSKNLNKIAGPNGTAASLTFDNIVLSGMDLTGLRMSLSTFENCDFEISKLDDTHFRDVKFNSPNFYRVTLSKAMWERPVITGGSFLKTDFTNANISEFQILNSTVSGADNVNKAKWYSNTKLSTFKGSDLSYLDFSGQTLLHFSFEDTNLEFTILNDTNLSGSNFKNAYFYETEFYNANTFDVNFEGTDLTSALGL